MPEDQKNIYFACGDSIAKINALPQAEQVKEKGYDMLCMTDEEDEFVTTMLREYDSKSFLSVNEADLGLESEEEKEELEKKTQENKELLDFVKETLNGAIVEAKISNKLKSHAVCLVSTGGVSLEMEKYFELLPGEDKPKAERVLELNAAHASFTALKNAFKKIKRRLQSMRKYYTLRLYSLPACL